MRPAAFLALNLHLFLRNYIHSTGDCLDSAWPPSGPISIKPSAPWTAFSINFKNKGPSMTGDMLGLGALTLPSVFARLGWVPALVIMTVCAIGTIYSGRLFTLLVEKASLSTIPLASWLHCQNATGLPCLTAEALASHPTPRPFQGCRSSKVPRLREKGRETSGNICRCRMRVCLMIWAVPRWASGAGGWCTAQCT